MNPLEENKIHQNLKEHPGWEYYDNAIHTSLQFSSFKDAFAMMTRIAFEAEEMQHHPDWTNVYNTLHISLNTHDAGGVTKKDFELAKIIDKLVG
jgi:4a-hydroxytetrahydrobiopterin dehydratase